MPAINPAFSSGTNTFVANPRSTGYLMTGFSRNEADFPVNKMIQIIETKNDVFMYGIADTSFGARSLTTDDHENDWVDGDMMPMNVGNQLRWSWQTNITKRKAYTWTLGQKAVEQAEWNILGQQGISMAQKAMTARSRIVYTRLSNATWGSYTSTVAAIAGAGNTWKNGTSTQPNFLLSLNYAAQQIGLQSYGTVNIKDLKVILSVSDAQALAASPEIRDYMRNNVLSIDVLRGDNARINMMYGLPPMFNDYELVVDNTVLVTGNQTAASSPTKAYLWQPGTSYVISRKGNLKGISGTPNYSTLQMYYYKDQMTVMQKLDADNRLYHGAIISDYEIVIPTVDGTPAGGFQFTATQG